MSKYIDERPFEEVVNSIVLDGKHEDYIDGIMGIILGDEKTEWRTNAFRGDSSIYEQEVFHLQKKRRDLQNDFDQIDKHYTSVLAKVAELEKTLGPSQDDNNEYDEEEEDDYYEEEVYEAKTKGKSVGSTKGSAMKPSQIAAKRRKDEIAFENFKTTLATEQEELRNLMAEIRNLDKEIKRYEYYHDVAVQCFRTLRRLIRHYRENKDIEFLKKGLYFTKNYSDMLLERYRDNQ